MIVSGSRPTKQNPGRSDPDFYNPTNPFPDSHSVLITTAVQVHSSPVLTYAQHQKELAKDGSCLKKERK